MSLFHSHAISLSKSPGQCSSGIESNQKSTFTLIQCVFYCMTFSKHSAKFLLASFAGLLMCCADTHTHTINCPKEIKTVIDVAFVRNDATFFCGLWSRILPKQNFSYEGLIDRMGCYTRTLQDIQSKFTHTQKLLEYWSLQTRKSNLKKATAKEKFDKTCPNHLSESLLDMKMNLKRRTTEADRK